MSVDEFEKYGTSCQGSRCEHGNDDNETSQRFTMEWNSILLILVLLGRIFQVFLKESLPGTFIGISEEIFKVKSLKEFLTELFQGIFSRK